MTCSRLHGLQHPNPMPLFFQWLAFQSAKPSLNFLTLQAQARNSLKIRLFSAWDIFPSLLVFPSFMNPFSPATQQASASLSFQSLIDYHFLREDFLDIATRRIMFPIFFYSTLNLLLQICIKIGI